jgi:hypothetical protein
MILEHAPETAFTQDHRGMLPIHHACLNSGPAAGSITGRLISVFTPGTQVDSFQVSGLAQRQSSASVVLYMPSHATYLSCPPHRIHPPTHIMHLSPRALSPRLSMTTGGCHWSALFLRAARESERSSNRLCEPFRQLRVCSTNTVDNPEPKLLGHPDSFCSTGAVTPPQRHNPTTASSSTIL